MRNTLLIILLTVTGCSLGEQHVIHPETGAVETDSGIVITGTDSTTITLTGAARKEFSKRISYFDVPIEDYWFEVHIARPIFIVPEESAGKERYGPEHNAIIDSAEKVYEERPDVVRIGGFWDSEIKKEYIKHKSHDCLEPVDGAIHIFENYYSIEISTELNGQDLTPEDTLNKTFYEPRFEN